LKEWYTDRSGGTKWDFVNGRMPERKVILYAQFVEANCTAQAYHLELKVENRLIKQICIVAGRFIMKPKNPVKLGYRFVGWYLQEKGGEK